MEAYSVKTMTVHSLATLLGPRVQLLTNTDVWSANHLAAIHLGM